MYRAKIVNEETNDVLWLHGTSWIDARPYATTYMKECHCIAHAKKAGILDGYQFFIDYETEDGMQGCETPYQKTSSSVEGIENALRGIPVLENEIVEINRNNGWNVCQPQDWEDDYKIPAILALIHSEVSEALEAFRKDDRANFVEELADVYIRLLDCTGGLRVDLALAIEQKLEKNRKRGYRHGGKRV